MEVKFEEFPDEEKEVDDNLCAMKALNLVVGEIPKEKVRHLRSEKSKEQNKDDIIVVRNIPEVLLDDLSELPPNQKIEFRIDLIPRAISVAKSPYRLAHSKIEELSGQLKELQDKGFIQPSSSP
nr:putative reverse transcriptase domain-containing protein [Tanacetum cinerariifolium]